MSSEDTNIIYKIPIELWSNILKYTNVPTISNFSCLNTHFNKIIDDNLWMFIDKVLKYTETILIPKTIHTFYKYRYIVDWHDIILYNQQCNSKIPEDVIVWIPETVDLEAIVLYQTLSEDIIRGIYPKVSWPTLLQKQRVPLDVIYCMIQSQNEEWSLSTSDWCNIWSKQKIDCNFITKYIDNIQWHPLSTNKDIISYDLISLYGENLIWHEFTKHGIHEDILKHFTHKFDFICWNNISRYTELSNDFIEKYLGNLDIGSVVRYQDISEKLLNTIVESFSDFDLDFYMSTIGSYQKISEDFILRYKDRLPFRTIIKNKRIPKSLVHKIYKDDYEIQRLRCDLKNWL